MNMARRDGAQSSVIRSGEFFLTHETCQQAKWFGNPDFLGRGVYVEF